MSKPTDTQEALRRAATVIQRLERQIAEAERARSEPIAIVGTGCRLPGGISDLPSLWRALERETDAVGPIAASRFEIDRYFDPDASAAGKTYTREAALLERVDELDASFFGVAPREAAWIDPQHRLLLECAWEALEQAGLAGQVRGAAIGVYVGIGPSDYAQRLGHDDPRKLEGYLATGTGASFSAGRLSFLLGLRGPAVAVDTACSSSLVALHLACEALRAGECEAAIAGGVQVLLSPEPFILLSRLRALSPDGRCKTFSDRADGYGRGEGCGVLVLKRLSAAQRDGDPILAVVRSSAINQDGASSGMTTPNGAAQSAVIRRALENAGLSPAEIDYVEAHGTGTALGDPIEVEALAETYGRDRTEPLRIGALKSNLGHLESAAGVAGVLKVIAALQNDALPASLHADPPSRHIDWSRLPVSVVRRLEAWKPGARRRRAGVSAFGMSGTNAHVILEEAPALPAAVAPPAGALPARPAELVLLSARSPEALEASARQLRDHLAAHPDLALGDLAFTLATARALHDHRLAFAVSSREALSTALESAARGEAPAGATRVQGREARGKLAWLFTGQGAQQTGMGHALYEAWPVFRAALDRAFAALDPELERPLRSVMWAEPGSSDAALLDQTAFTQPALFALEWALAELWRSWGVLPELVLGHSIGEITAAAVAGVFSLEDAARLVAARGRLMQALPAGGAMVSIAAPAAEVSAAIAAHAASVSIAAMNGPASTVISGVSADVLAIAERCAARGVQTKRLTVSHAFHSPLMEPMLDEFRRIAAAIEYGKARLPVVSNVSGRLAGDELTTPEYWVRHVRDAVRFEQGVRSLQAEGATLFLELGPRPTLLSLVSATLPGDARARLVASLRGGRTEPEAILDALGAIVAVSDTFDFAPLFPRPGRRLSLPAYPWQRQRFWIDPSSASKATSGEATDHPLLGARIASAGVDAAYEALVSAKEPAWLGDHKVGAHVVVPATAIAELVRAAGEDAREGRAVAVSSLVLQAAAVVPSSGALRLQVVLTEQGAHATVHGQLASAAAATPWTLHASASLSDAPLSAPPALDLAALRRRCARALDVAQTYDYFASIGLDYGRSFRGLHALWQGADEALAEIELDEKIAGEGYGLHPALLDAAFHAVAGALTHSAERAMLPFELGRLSVFRHGATSAVVHVQITEASADRAVAEVRLADTSGNLIATIESLRLRSVDVAALGQNTAQPAHNALFRLDWLPLDASGTVTLQGRWLLATASGAEQAESWLASALRSHGATCSFGSARQLGSLDVDHIVYVAGGGREEIDASTIVEDGLALALAAKGSTRLWLVTSGAVATVPGEDVSPSGAALWGFGRTLQQERPELSCTLLDIDDPEALPDVIARELAAGDGENQLAYRDGKRHVARLVRATVSPVPTSADYQLQTKSKGALDSLVLVPAERRAPGPNEVEIEVRSSGLNFRDVLNALGMYPGNAGPLGGECSGVVTAVGSSVSSLAVGDRVMALAAGTFRRFVTVDARLATTIPRGLSFEQAAAVPVVFLTAWYALHELAALRRGERLLVHAAAGGVGMAAVQIARQLGARVLATASPGKWSTVQSLGVELVASSRDLSFADSFRSAAGGADVVLNSLATDFIDHSLALLSPGGRFIEMGKVDVRDPDSVAQAHPGVLYRAFDLGQLDPDHIARLFAAVKQGFEDGALSALPVRTFPLSEAEAAFRFMAQARHVGKIVLAAPAKPITPESTVLITGGLGALGLEVADHFARQGVRHLVLTSRRGLDAPGARAAVAELEKHGAKVTVAAVDVSDRAALARVIATLPREYPLRGVVHAAGVVDDGLLAEQTPERFARVLAPKIGGASSLHALTRELELDFFVLFSSLAGTLGSAAQSAYAAANAFLDGLAARRKASGLPAISLAWGPWAERGMAAQLDGKLQARFARQGIGMITRDSGLALLQLTLSRSEPQLVVVPLDLRAAAGSFGADVPPLWRALIRPASSAVTRHGGWSRELSALPGEQRLAAVAGVIRAEIARVLSLSSPDLVPLDKPLQELGLDSLMAVELRNSLSRRAGVTLPATLAFDYPTPDAIAKHLLADVLKITATPAATPASLTRVDADEPIAIVGIGCRFPGGASDPEALWRLLDEGIDAVTEIPKERWDIDEWYDPDPDAPGKMTTRWGAFLDDIERFDPLFFGLSPREAVSVDPQERLLLETTWEALEHAGIKPDSLMGSDTGVYMGLCGSEYQSRVVADVESLDAYGMLGTMHSTMVGRLSYWLGLKGPNLPIDTACSSSLVAVHLASQSLRSGECQLAIAGGANVLLAPEGMVYFSRLRAMSPTGRCHSFSADADGYVRAEGAGVVVLERLSDARKNGHRVLAIVRSTAVNQDGRSNGLTAPNGPSQQAVIREALQRAGVAPADVGYVECHGTGTPLGDPIEVQALASVLGEGRPADQPVILGSLKSNLGHMEGAAGVGGLIKAVLTLQHARIPQSLHFDRPNPHIDWQSLPVQVAAEPLPWPRNGKPRIAGVSSFGISGTNAHAILEEAPAPDAEPSAPARSAELLLLSARSPEALDASARRLRDHIAAHPDVSLGDLAFTLLEARTHLEHRIAFGVSSREALLGALDSAARGETPAGATRAVTREQRGKLAWLFTGQGAQQLGMGRALYDEWPAFRDALDAACAALDPHLPRPLRSVMWAEQGSAEAALLDQTGFTQPALFTLEWALAQLWLAFGVQPQLLAGHSIGEVTAAAIAGVFSLEDAARLVAARGRLMQALPAGGAMVSIAAAEQEVAAAIAALSQTVSIAASNAPSSTVISGVERDVLAVAERFSARGVQTRRLAVSHAFHSPLMQPMLSDFRAVAGGIRYSPPRIPVVSNLTGELAGDELTQPEYWVRHVREAVRFARGARALHAAGASTFVELGPRSTLLSLVSASLPGGTEAHLLSSLRAGRSEPEAILDALAAHLALGGSVPTEALFPAGGRKLPLPSYPWQRQRFWIESPGRLASGDATDHPLLGVRVASAGHDALYESTLSATEPVWLSDHRVGDRIVVPATAIAELIRAAGQEQREGQEVAVSDLLLQAPLVVPRSGSLRVQVILNEQGTKASVHSQPARAPSAAPWTTHATATLGAAAAPPASRLDLAALRQRCTVTVPIEQTYASLAALGLVYGPAFRALRSLQQGDREALAELGLGESLSSDGFGLHPALLDAALQAVAALLESSERALLPFALGRLEVFQRGATAAMVHVQLASSTADGAVANIQLADDSGKLIATVDALRLRTVDVGALGAAPSRRLANAFFRLDWLAQDTSDAAAIAGHWLIVAPSGDEHARALSKALRGKGASATVVASSALAAAPAAEHVLLVAREDLAADDTSAVLTALALTQALLARSPAPRLWLVTRGAVSVQPGEDVASASSALWGFGRTLQQEQPELSCTLLDIDDPEALPDVIALELAASDGEDQLAYRNGKRHVARLVPAPSAAVPTSADYQLQTKSKGALDSLVLVPAERRAPGPNEVEIEVRSSGLNFRDVLNALGMYPGDAGPLGGECSGVVTAVGSSVSSLAVGDRVMALAAGTFRRFVTVDARLATTIPRGLSFEQAAAVPVVFLTAWYALHELAALQRGERLLVHAAAGGVGMAAVQIARQLGARVLATASPGKWSTVQSLGVELVASSRDLSFADSFRSAAGGADVVLNSLATDFIDHSLALLSPGGRFIEMGKVDVRDPGAVAQAHPGVLYRAFDLGQLDPDHIARLFAAVKQGFEDGALSALPVRTFPVRDAEAAFRFMAQARHVGKIVLQVAARPPLADATVLITGGLGALGLEVARHFARRGVGHLLLTGRRGSDTPDARAAVAELEALGARVSVAALDVADRAAVARALAALPREYPLRGVVHAAGVVDDGLLAEQTPERFARVLAPKVAGALNLHELTRDSALDFFVLFSSIAGTLGSAAQSAYSAANAFLDGLAARRKASGLPAISLAWGPWAERGMAAHLDSKLQARFARQGVSLLAPEQGLELLDDALSRGDAHLVVVPLDLRVAARSLDAAIPPLWRALVRSSSSSTGAARGAWARELSALPSEQRAAAIAAVIRGEIARVLSLSSPDLVPLDKPLQELGLDSLMAVELRNSLSRRAGVTLPATLAFDYPTPDAIAKHLLADVLKISETTSSSAPAPVAASHSDEPIAIVGIGCRFPGGASDPEALWRLLDEGIDAVTEIPRERWDIDEWYDPDPDAVGKMNTRWGAFVDDIERFDPLFFGLSPREAVSVDPQERLLLETTWEALEHAGIKPDSLMGTDTGVYMGLCGVEYQARVVADVESLDAYGMLGTMHSTMVGRISYWLGIKGPNLPIDTACSSSLVAVHLASHALRNGECQLAIAGGANVLLAPEGMVYFSRLRAMSPTGRCHSFSADADGYVRAEGAGVVVLERLSDARKNGHRVLAIVRSTAVNQDGRSNGLTAPNGPSQQAVIREALQRAGVAPADVGYVECHGTGTPLGDPIEVQALASVLGEGRPANQPVILGSLKSNLGHMEGAAGVGGLIKAVLTLQHGHIPQSLHFDRPNPHIDWQSLPVKVAARAMPWPRDGKPRIAGVSSFGISGTNAHAILEEAPPAPPQLLAPLRSAELILLSAKSSDALDATAARLREHLSSHPDVSLGDLAFSLATSRALLEHRLAFSVTSRDALEEALDVAARGELPTAATRAVMRAQRGKLAWLFTGQGAQQLGMGRALYDEWPAFRDALDAACSALDPHLPRPLRSVMWAEQGSTSAALLDQTGFTQPGLFAFEWALAQLWLSWGVRPELLLGHSIGEVTAATVAGVFSLEDAGRLVAARARLMQALPSGGAMISIAASERDVAAAVAARAASVAIGAVNGPASVVISGVEADALAIAKTFSARGVQTKRLTVSHAFHSPLMQPMLSDFRAVAASVTFSAPRIPIVSNLTGQLASSELTQPEYWVRHVRETVRFAHGARAAHAAGAATFLELGPRPTLLSLVSASLPASAEPRLVPSLRSSRAEPEAILDALGGLVAHGTPFDARGLFPRGGRRLSLPTYAWQRQRYWIDGATSRHVSSGEATNHPLLGVRVITAHDDAIYESVISSRQPTWLAEHRVGEHIIVPAAAIAELVRAAAEDDRKGRPTTIHGLTFFTPLIVPATGSLSVQVILSAQGTKATVHSRSNQGGSAAAWTVHASAQLGDAPLTAPKPLDPGELKSRGTPADVAALYASFAALGLDYGPSFRGIQALWQGEREALAEVRLDKTSTEGYALHPALLDAAFQAVAGALPRSGSQTLLPFELGRCTLYESGSSAAQVYVRIREAGASGVIADVQLSNADGKLIAEVESLRLRTVDIGALGREHNKALRNALLHVDWLPLEAAPTSRISGRWLVIAQDSTALARQVAAGLTARGAITTIASPEAVTEAPDVEHVLYLAESTRDADAPTGALLDVLALTQVLVTAQVPPRLWLVTRAAVAVQAGDDVSAPGATLWGFGRTLHHERPELACTLVDVDTHELLPDKLACELALSEGENQIVWREGVRHVARLTPAAANRVPSSDDYELRTERKGSLESLTLAAAERGAPGRGEVEIEVVASGLNFRDVLNALGMYPGNAGNLGNECAGVVSAVGSGVTGLSVGDRVMALAGGAFRRFVSVDARLVSAIPRGLGFEQAAAIPIVFLTAWYALHDLAALKRGERIVIHAAAGGVGMAAIQLARQIGAQVLATASPPKWQAVKALGVEHVASSRDLSFADAFRSAAGGADVVLNSLAGEFIDTSLSLLGQGGRFLEMGKVDIRAAADVAAAHPGVAYQAFDLAEVDPDHIARMLAAIKQGFEDGVLTPLPVRTFAITDAEAAFRFMAQARHIGKIVLKAPSSPLTPDSTVLISGGLGALGLAVARQLARRGVRHLLLTGRRGLQAPAAAEAVAELRALGSEVTVAALDIADRDALARAIEAIPVAYPLRGVVHAAGVVDDGVLTEQTRERFAAVLAPKVQGALNLHQLTLAHPLDFFVLFSSLAGTLGSTAQTAYAAANTFLDALAAHRRAHDRPAISLAWGPWAERGMAASLDRKLQARFARQGISMITPDQGVQFFEAALTRSEAHLLVVPLDLRVVAESYGSNLPPLWRALVRTTARADQETDREWLNELRALPEEERLGATSALVRRHVARVLSLKDGDVPTDRPLQELGMDSLTALEVKSALSRATGVTLPATIIFDYPTVEALSGYLLSQLFASASQGEEGQAPPKPVAQALLERPAEPIAPRPPSSVRHPVPPSPQRAVASCECLTPLAAPRLRLFCFHDAAGSAETFAPFAQLASAGIEVHTISHARGGAVDAAAYLEQVTRYIAELSDEPYALFGHSLGSLIALAVAQGLEREAVPPPVLFVPSAPPPATLTKVLREQMDIAFRITFGEGHSLDNVRSDFAADVALWQSLEQEGDAPLLVPIAAFVGASDHLVSETDTRAWEARTTAGYSLIVLPGDHFYLHQPDSRQLLLAELEAQLLMARARSRVSSARRVSVTHFS